MVPPPFLVAKTDDLQASEEWWDSFSKQSQLFKEAPTTPRRNRGRRVKLNKKIQ
jgi:hypothetical protein